jgi:hypothetical protein
MSAMSLWISKFPSLSFEFLSAALEFMLDLIASALEAEDLLLPRTATEPLPLCAEMLVEPKLRAAAGSIKLADNVSVKTAKAAWMTRMLIYF